MEKYQKTSNELKRIACALAVFIPFDTAINLLSNLFYIEISSSTLWNWVQTYGRKVRDQLSQQEFMMGFGQTINCEDISKEDENKIAILGADGVMVPIRPIKNSPKGRTVYKEVKVGVIARIFEIIKENDKKVRKLVNRRLVAVLGNINLFEKAFKLESKKQKIEQAKKVFWLSDGGTYFWDLWDKMFSKISTGILDFYHGAENLFKGATALFNKSSAKADKWFKINREKLKAGKVEQIINELTKKLNLKRLTDESKNIIRRLIAYLTKHKDHMNYPKYKEEGSPIGSGVVESACKWLIQQRFKCVGMRWSMEGLENLLALRIAWVNERFDQIFFIENKEQDFVPL